MELERKKALLVKTGYYLLFACAAFIALRYLWGLLLPFLLGFLIAYTLRPTAGFIARHSKISGRWASIVASIVFYSVMALVLWFLGFILFLGVEQLSQVLPVFYAQKLEPAIFAVSEKLMAFTGKLTSASQVLETIHSAVKNILLSASNWSVNLLTSLLSAVPMAILTVIFTVLSSVLICADYGEVTGFVLRQIPQRYHTPLLEIRDYLAKSLLKIIKTYIILMGITFAILAAGLWILRVDNALVFAGVIAFLDLLPVLGSGAVLIPWGIGLLLMGQGYTGAGMLLLWAVLSFVRQLLEPRIMGRQIGLHPLVTLTAMYLGLKLAGFSGLILAPVACLLICFMQEKGWVKIYRKKNADTV